MDSIYTFWKSNPNLWFNASPDDDKYIYEKFYNIIDNHNHVQGNYIKLTEWTSYCIYYDQLIKHFNRHLNTNLVAPDNFVSDCYLNYNKFRDELSDFDFMFQLMPLRHTHQLIHVKFVLNETWHRLSLNKENMFIRKFLIATYERYIKCTKENNLIIDINNLPSVFIHDEILDKISPRYNTNITTSITTSSYTHPLYICMDEFIKNNKLINKTIIVSISGGVDSMVCSYLLKQLMDKYINLKIKCVHIDYYNREECEKEEELLIWWCNTILKIPLYIRRIDEINRPKCMEYELRDLYESYTKNVRFNSYISLGSNNINIILGHNKDDTIENIFTNTASQSHYDNLLGMEPISYQSYKDKDICFLRPLINTPKKDIYDFAIKNNIPFLQDSTPKWSQRGKIRDIVKPALNEWNPLIFDGLINLSEKMSQMTVLLEKLITPNIENIKYNNINEVPTDSIYWNIVLKKNDIYITQKTLSNLINRIEYYQKFPHKLRDLQKIQLRSDGDTNTMMLLKQSSKPVERLHICIKHIEI
jgi:tRNA(Ile)-lysidine synthetase-like protein